MRVGFKGCYERWLQEQPQAEGRVRLTIHVDCTGGVEGVEANATGRGLSEAFLACVVARGAAAQFAPPMGGRAAVQVPITFVRE
jgi:hypothetical protein